MNKVDLIIEGLRENRVDEKAEQLYYAKVNNKGYNGDGFKSLDVAYLGISDDQIITHSRSNIKSATALTKDDWSKYISRCTNRFITTGKISYIKAPSDGNVITMYFQPSKAKGTLKLGDIKNQLKAAGIKILSTDDDEYSERYSGFTKYYSINVPYADKDKIEQYVKVNHAQADIGFARPDRNISCSSKLTVDK